MMRKTIAALLFYLGLASAALAQNTNVVVPATTAQIPIVGTAAARTKIVTGINGKSIYVTAVQLVPVATSAVTFSTGTGTNCASNTATLTGVLTFATGETLSFGSGLGAVWVLPSGFDLCITISTAVAPGSLAYAQF